VILSLACQWRDETEIRGPLSSVRIRLGQLPITLICRAVLARFKCGSVLRGISVLERKSKTLQTRNMLESLLNAAARLVSDTNKFDRGLSQLMHVDLHWLDVPERVNYKLVLMVHNCLHRNRKAPQCLVVCIPISDVASRRHLRSASRHHLVVPRHNLSTYGRRAFAVAGPAAWNSLSDDLCDPALSTDSFRCLLKTRSFLPRNAL